MWDWVLHVQSLPVHTPSQPHWHLPQLLSSSRSHHWEVHNLHDLYHAICLLYLKLKQTLVKKLSAWSMRALRRQINTCPATPQQFILVEIYMTIFVVLWVASWGLNTTDKKLAVKVLWHIRHFPTVVTKDMQHGTLLHLRKSCLNVSLHKRVNSYLRRKLVGVAREVFMFEVLPWPIGWSILWPSGWWMSEILLRVLSSLPGATYTISLSPVSRLRSIPSGLWSTWRESQSVSCNWPSWSQSLHITKNVEAQSILVVLSYPINVD